LVPKSLDTILSFFSLSGSFEISTLILVIILFLYERNKIITTTLFYLFGLGIEVIAKNLIEHPGPPAQFYRYSLGFLFPTSLYQTSFSYPSGHSFRVSFIFIIIGYIVIKSLNLNKLTKLSIFILITFYLIIMLISRISLGEH